MSRHRVDLNRQPEVAKAADQALGDRRLVAAVEMGGAKVSVRYPALEHVIGRSEDRGRDGEDGLFLAAAGAEADELGVQVRVAMTDGRPRRLHQRGLEPAAATGRAWTSACPHSRASPATVRPTSASARRW